MTGSAASWNEIQRGFVDDPRQSLQSADLLVAEIMRARGYPVDDDFDRRADDLSVDHPRVVQHYREARQVRDASGEVDTERQRTAVTSYRSLIDALLGDGDTADTAASADTAHDTRRTEAEPGRRPARRPAERRGRPRRRHIRRPAHPRTTNPGQPTPTTRGGPGAPGPRSTRDDHFRTAYPA